MAQVPDVRIVSKELLAQLDPVERIVAEQYLIEGHWKLEE